MSQARTLRSDIRGPHWQGCPDWQPHWQAPACTVVGPWQPQVQAAPIQALQVQDLISVFMVVSREVGWQARIGLRTVWEPEGA